MNTLQRLMAPRRIDLQNGDHIFHLPITYELAHYLSTETDVASQHLVTVRHLLCEEDGTRVFDIDTPLNEVADSLPFDVIIEIANHIVAESASSKRSETIVKKPVS